MLFCLLELEDEYFIPIYSSIQSSNIFPAKPMRNSIIQSLAGLTI